MSKNDKMSYSPDRIHTTASNIMANASTSLANHETAWSNVQRYIDRFPSFMQGPVRVVFSSYEQRLRRSYEWQKDYAKALNAFADAVSVVDQDVNKSFDDN